MVQNQEIKEEKPSALHHFPVLSQHNKETENKLSDKIFQE